MLFPGRAVPFEEPVTKYTMKKIFLLLTLFAGCLTGRAQEAPESPDWFDVSWLHHVATGGSNESKGLLQFMMFPAGTVEANEALFSEFKTLMEEIMQVNINQTLPANLQEMEDNIRQAREQLKDHPELLAQIDEAFRQFEGQRQDALKEYTDDRKSYSIDPAALLRRLQALAVNRKAYTGWWEAGKGLYSVIEAPRYANLTEDPMYSATKITMADVDRYKWGLIDENGRQILPYQYSSCNVHALFSNGFPEDDVMFLYKQDPDGSVHAGAIDYSGRVRIPFIYDDNRDEVYHHQEAVPFEKNGKVGWVSRRTGEVMEPFEYETCKAIAYGWLVSKGGKYGFVSRNSGKLVVPVKYKGLWDEGPEMLRFDGKVDIYDENGRLQGEKAVEE